MIFHSVEPRSREWRELRLGIPTSSNFSRIVTPAGKPSTQAPVFLNQLLAEYILQAPIDEAEFQSQWMERGQELEDEAKRAAEFMLDIETSLGGFFTDDRGLIGCSPDRLIDPDGILEIKAPSPQVMIHYLLGGPLEEKYRPQLQGMLWLTEREYVKIIAYHPQFPHRVIHVGREEKYIAVLSAGVQAFVDNMVQRRELLKSEFGIVPRIAAVLAPDPLERYEFTEQDAEDIIASKFPTKQLRNN